MALGAVNAAIPPLMLGATPQHMIGRVEPAMNPLLSLAGISSMGAAGILTSTALRGFHATVAGISCGPYDTVFAVAGLLFHDIRIRLNRAPATAPAGAVHNRRRVAPVRPRPDLAILPIGAPEPKPAGALLPYTGPARA